MSKKLSFVSILVGICLAVGVYALNSARRRNLPGPPSVQNKQNYPAQVTSCAKQIKVIKAETIDAGKPDESINVQVENLSDLGIIAISLEATDGVSSYITTLRSSFKTDKLQVVIKPHDIGNLSMTSPFGEVPLRIGGVMFEDDSEEGCDSSLKTLHEVKDYEKKKEPLNETNPPASNPPSSLVRL